MSLSKAVAVAGLWLVSGAAMAQGPDAAEAPVDGGRVYELACAQCHSGGPGGFFTRAPRIGSPLLQQRLSEAGSMDALTAAVKRGKGKMPPQAGGKHQLTDADLKAATEFMLAAKPR